MAEIPWLRDILRFTLTATTSDPPWLATSDVRATGDKLVDPDDPGKDPRFRKLVEAILFGRRFLKTYNLVLLGIVVIFTVWHWGEKVVLHRRKRRIIQNAQQNRAEEEEEVWSSSSSTIEGNTTPPTQSKTNAGHASETSPLLSSSNAPQYRVSPLWQPYYLFKAMLQYQPRPIPIVDKVLPTNAVSLLVLAWLALIAFYNFYCMPLSFMYLFVFADRCGIIFISNLPLLYLLGAKNQPLKFLTGYSYESLNIFHRRVGEVMCLEAFLHFAGMWVTWYGMLRHLGFTLAKFVFNRVVLLGLAAFIAYEVIYFTSLGSFRQRWYEVFLGLHIVLQVAGLVFLWFHHYTSRPYVGISMAIWLVDRAVFRLWARRSAHPATMSVMDDGETVLLSANWKTEPRKLIFAPKNMSQGWEPNQHVFITVPALGKKHVFQSHPFTIFSAAPTSTSPSGLAHTNNHAWFSLLIRAQAKSGFAHTLLTHALTHSQTQIHLDGPYGSPHALDILQTSQTAILIAGGSGIAVAYPLLYALLKPHSTTPTDIEASSTKSTRTVKLLWITHAPEHRLWIPEDKMHELQNWGLDVLIPPPTSMAGRPDVQAVLDTWVGEEKGRSAVVVSGPEGLVRDVRNGCAGLMRRGRDVDVVVEKFGW